jgi:hypothetical protein
MALDQSDLSNLLVAPKSGDSVDLVRDLVRSSSKSWSRPKLDLTRFRGRGDLRGRAPVTEASPRPAAAR